MNAAVNDSYAKFLADLESGFQQLPDKPEETAAATLAALAQLGPAARSPLIADANAPAGARCERAASPAAPSHAAFPECRWRTSRSVNASWVSNCWPAPRR